MRSVFFFLTGIALQRMTALEPGTCRSQLSLGKEMMVRKSLKCLVCYVLVVVRKNAMRSFKVLQ